MIRKHVEESNNNNNNNSISKLCYDRYIIRVNNRNIHKNRPNISVVMIDRTIKEAFLKDVAIYNSHNLQSTPTEKFQKYKRIEKKSLWECGN